MPDAPNHGEDTDVKIYEAVGHALQEEGVSTVFGLMGDGNLRLLTYWSESLAQRYFGTRHESAAVAMADGYARVSGEVGVCTTTQGPGVTNTLTALVTARKARTPLLLMVGDVAGFQQNWPQDVDHEAVFAAADVPLVKLADPKTAYSDVVAAIRFARSRRGPVGLNLPVDVQEMEWNAWEDEPPALEPVEMTAGPDRQDIARAADLLAAAKRPVVIGGRGAVEADCAAQLIAIGDRIGAVFATSLRGKGLFGSHPYTVGLAGGLGSNLSAQLIGEADVALVVGAALNDFTTMRGSLLNERAAVIRCDIDPDRAGNAPGGVGFAVDANMFCAALDAELTARGVESEGYRPRASERLREYSHDSEFRGVHEPDVLDPRELVIRLDQILPAERTVVTDAGHFFGYPVAYMQVPNGRAFVCGIDFGSIGLGIGHALGAAVAAPERRTILFVGDGGLLMNLGELETAVRYQIPLLIVVLNDGAYGSELQILRLWDLPERLSVFPDTNFASAARALGLRASTVRSEDDLAKLSGDLTFSEPMLVDCKITKTVRAAWLEEAFRH
jgi:thiamine pyrophosphate-dependent acetolactate synthase large subunit-like protein